MHQNTPFPSTVIKNFVGSRAQLSPDPCADSTPLRHSAALPVPPAHISKQCYITRYITPTDHRVSVDAQSPQLMPISRAGERPPVTSRRGGAHVWSGASCYVWEKFSGRVQICDGCCSVRRLLKRSPEN